MNRIKYISYIVILITVLLSKAVIFEFYRVTTASMSDTIIPGDFILINKLVFGTNTPNRISIPIINYSFSVKSFKIPRLRKIRQGDIVVIKNTRFAGSSNNLVKRVAASEGQIVSVIDDFVFVDGVLINTENIKGSEIAITDNYNFQTFTVPENSIYVIGDNSGHSYDSRNFGYVSESEVIGKAVLIYASIDIDGVFRWKRFFKGL